MSLLTKEQWAEMLAGIRDRQGQGFTQEAMQLGLGDAPAGNRVQAQAICVRYLQNTLGIPVLDERPGALKLALRDGTRWVALWDGVDLPKEHE